MFLHHNDVISVSTRTKEFKFETLTQLLTVIFGVIKISLVSLKYREHKNMLRMSNINIFMLKIRTKWRATAAINTAS